MPRLTWGLTRPRAPAPGWDRHPPVGVALAAGGQQQQAGQQLAGAVGREGRRERSSDRPVGDHVVQLRQCRRLQVVGLPPDPRGNGDPPSTPIGQSYPLAGPYRASLPPIPPLPCGGAPGVGGAGHAWDIAVVRRHCHCSAASASAIALSLTAATARIAVAVATAGAVSPVHRSAGAKSAVKPLVGKLPILRSHATCRCVSVAAATSDGSPSVSAGTPAPMPRRQAAGAYPAYPPPAARHRARRAHKKEGWGSTSSQHLSKNASNCHDSGSYQAVTTTTTAWVVPQSQATGAD